MRILILLSLLLSCQTFEQEGEKYHEAPAKEKAVVFKPINIKGVEHAFDIIGRNHDSSKETAQQGAARADQWVPLFVKLIGVYQFGYSLTAEDLKPYMRDLKKVSAIFVAEESKTFAKNSAQNEQALDTVKTEVSKGAMNIEADAAKDAKILELQDKLDSKITEKTTGLSEKFFYLGGLCLFASFFANVSFLAPITDKLRNGGAAFLLTGGIILAFGNFLSYIEDFMHTWGNVVFTVCLIPLIGLLWLTFIKKGDQTLDEIQDDAET